MSIADVVNAADRAYTRGLCKPMRNAFIKKTGEACYACLLTAAVIEKGLIDLNEEVSLNNIEQKARDAFGLDMNATDGLMWGFDGEAHPCCFERAAWKAGKDLAEKWKPTSYEVLVKEEHE